MMRLLGAFIKHEMMKDVCFEVHKVLDLPHKVVIKGCWHNLGFTESYNMNIKQSIKIPREKLAEWEYCKEPRLKCLRNAKWGRIK